MAHIIDEVRIRRRSQRHNRSSYWVETLEQFFHCQRKKMTQTFRLDPGKDNLIVGANGMRFRIPAGTFEDSWGIPVRRPVVLELIELQNKA